MRGKTKLTFSPGSDTCYERCTCTGIFISTGVGMQWSNFYRPVNVNDDISLLHVMLMLVVDCVIFAVVTWYVDAVRPGEFGVPQPLYFPFTVSACVCVCAITGGYVLDIVCVRTSTGVYIGPRGVSMRTITCTCQSIFYAHYS